MPLVWQTDPTIRCVLAGRAMPDSVRALQRDGLAILGEVDTPHDVFAQVRLTVASLRFGAGLKGKVIESLAAGVPCVGTPVAYEGMALPFALNGVVRERPEDLAAAILRLHCDVAENMRIAAAGLAFARAEYPEARIDTLLRKVVRLVLRRWPGGAMSTDASRGHGGIASAV